MAVSIAGITADGVGRDSLRGPVPGGARVLRDRPLQEALGVLHCERRLVVGLLLVAPGETPDVPVEETCGRSARPGG